MNAAVAKDERVMEQVQNVLESNADTLRSRSGKLNFTVLVDPNIVQADNHREKLEHEELIASQEDEGDAVPFHLQGDKAFDSHDVLLIRNGLKNNAAILDQTEAYWKLLPKLKRQDEEVISEKEYCDLMLLIFKALRRDFDEPSARAQVKKDWEVDSQHQIYMNKHLFHDSIFELVDMWTCDVEEDTYVKFLSLLLKRIALPIVVFVDGTTLKLTLSDGKTSINEMITDSIPISTIDTFNHYFKYLQDSHIMKTISNLASADANDIDKLRLEYIESHSLSKERIGKRMLAIVECLNSVSGIKDGEEGNATLAGFKRLRSINALADTDPLIIESQRTKFIAQNQIKSEFQTTIDSIKEELVKFHVDVKSMDEEVAKARYTELFEDLVTQTGMGIHRSASHEIDKMSFELQKHGIQIAEYTNSQIEMAYTDYYHSIVSTKGSEVKKMAQKWIEKTRSEANNISKFIVQKSEYIDLNEVKVVQNGDPITSLMASMEESDSQDDDEDGIGDDQRLGSDPTKSNGSHEGKNDEGTTKEPKLIALLRETLFKRSEIEIGRSITTCAEAKEALAKTFNLYSRGTSLNCMQFNKITKVLLSSKPSPTQLKRAFQYLDDKMCGKVSEEQFVDGFTRQCNFTSTEQQCSLDASRTRSPTSSSKKKNPKINVSEELTKRSTTETQLKTSSASTKENFSSSISHQDNTDSNTDFVSPSLNDEKAQRDEANSKSASRVTSKEKIRDAKDVPRLAELLLTGISTIHMLEEEDAFVRINEQRDLFDLICYDIGDHLEEGMDTLKKLRNIVGDRIILLGGDSSRIEQSFSLSKQCMEEGLIYFAMVPIDFKELRNHIQEFLDNCDQSFITRQRNSHISSGVSSSSSSSSSSTSSANRTPSNRFRRSVRTVATFSSGTVRKPLQPTASDPSSPKYSTQSRTGTISGTLSQRQSARFQSINISKSHEMSPSEYVCSSISSSRQNFATRVPSSGNTPKNGDSSRTRTFSALQSPPRLSSASSKKW